MKHSVIEMTRAVRRRLERVVRTSREKDHARRALPDVAHYTERRRLADYHIRRGGTAADNAAMRANGLGSFLSSDNVTMRAHRVRVTGIRIDHADPIGS